MEGLQLSFGILAGGKSRRMERDKAALQIGGQTFLECLITEFEGKGPLMVAVRDEKQGREIGVPSLNDNNQGIGPIEGIRNLLDWSPTEYIFICACDTPYLRYELAEYLLHSLPCGYDCCVLSDGERIHPLSAVYSRRLAESAEQMIAGGTYRIMTLLEMSRTKIIDIRDTGLPVSWIRNINTIQDYTDMTE